MPNKYFTKRDLQAILDGTINKTFGQVDKNDVFMIAENNSKVTGIAGMVVEQSVLEYPKDNRQEADLIVDDSEVELKVTGLRRKNGSTNQEYTAKEPMSITAVSPEYIVDETFYTSHFWNKIAKMLIVYYLYNSDKTVKAKDYANFPILGYDLHEFSQKDVEILKNDWTIVRDFIKNVQDNGLDKNIYYPEISHLRNQLLYLDTAPKWPHSPRFRFRRAFVDTIAQEYFGKQFELIPTEITSLSELLEFLNTLKKKYKGKTILEITSELGIKPSTSTGNFSKSIGEQIIAAVFGSKSKKMRNVELFSKLGIIPKTLILSNKSKRTEDTKFGRVDFDEYKEINQKFENSSVYEYFSQSKFLFAIFKEVTPNAPLADDIFVDFNLFSFPSEFIETDLQRTWKEIKDRIVNHTFEEKVIRDKEGNPITNKNGVVRTAINLPKSRTNKVFVRGTSSNSSYKPLNVQGISMYIQQYWIKGNVMVEMLENNPDSSAE